MGDRTFDEAYPELLRSAYRAALRVTGDATAAEEAAAEALTRALLRWGQVAGHARPWVVRVATNLAIDHSRSVARRRRLAPDRSATAPQEADDHVDLHRALRELPRRQRQVVVLRYFGDLSEQEIAEELGLAAGTVKSHASRGLVSLRRRLDPDPPPAVRSEVLP